MSEVGKVSTRTVFDCGLAGPKGNRNCSGRFTTRILGVEKDRKWALEGVRKETEDERRQEWCKAPEHSSSAARRGR